MAGVLSAQTGTFADWKVNANGNWGDAANWTGAIPTGTYPSGIGATASVVQDINGTRTISLLDGSGAIDVTLGTLILGDTNATNAFLLGAVGSGGKFIFDNGGAGALLDHSFKSGGTTTDPSKSPNGSDRIEAQVLLNDDLTIFANTNIEFRDIWTGNSNNITLTGNGRVYWNGSNASTARGTISAITDLNIYNGEARFDGIAGIASSNVVDAATIRIGDGLVTTGGVGFRTLPRFYLVNVESTVTSNIFLNGGMIISDLGTLTPMNGDGMDILSGTINVTGPAVTNLIDVNDAGTAEVHYVTGVFEGPGGFSKINAGSLNLLSNNTLGGEIYVQRAGPGGAALTAKGGLTLSGADGALSAAQAIIMSRDGSLYLDNSGTVNNNRVADTADVILRGQGRIRMVGNSASATSETFGDLVVETGSGKINFDLDDTNPQAISLTFSSFTRSAGSIAQFQVLDNTPGAFGSLLGGNASLFITDQGASALLKGGGGANGSTNQTLVVGAYGGVNNLSNHFMTFDKLNPTELRPLDFDTEYLKSSTLVDGGVKHTINATTLGTLDQNLMINYNVDRAGDPDGDVDWYGNRPVRMTSNSAVNSLRFGVNVPTSTTNAQNTNEIGAALVLNPGAVLYLGDSLAANTGLSGNTDGSGMVLFGRDVTGTNPGRNQYIAGGILDFGSREAIFVNESGNSAFIRSEIRGSGGLTKAGVNHLYLDNSNSYTGETTIAEGLLILRDQNALGGSNIVNIQGSGQLYLELGTNIINSTISSTPPDLYVGTTDASRTILYSNSANNTWGGNIIIDAVDSSGNWVFESRLGTNALATLNINGDIYSNDIANPINTDTALNDARLLSTAGVHSSGGIINLNGQFKDNVNGVGGVGAAISSDVENQLLRFQIRGSNELVVNARQQWDAAGRIYVEQGILRYEGDGNFFTDDAAIATNTGNGQSGIRMGGTAGGTNNGTANNAIILTKAGQVLNINRIDIGGDGTNNFNALGNTMLAGTNTSGTVTFGNGNERILFTQANSTNGPGFTRDLSVYAAEGGTVDLNFWLDDQGANVSSWLTKIGRGTVNYNSRNSSQSSDVEGVFLSGGLLRLSNYTLGTGVRFATGARTIFGGGGLEMDGTATSNRTENLTGEVRIMAGGTDVIVSSATGRTTTLNIGAGAAAFTRESGGTLALVENTNGGVASIITLNGATAPGQGELIPYASYGSGMGTDFATDFAMRSDSAGNIATFSGATRQNEDDPSAWAAGNDVSEDVAGFSAVATSAGLAINSLHFDMNAASTLNVDAGGLTITSGGILISSAIDSTSSTKTIEGGSITAGANDLIIHQYGAGALTINSVIEGTSLVKTGPGDLILGAANNYIGNTYFNGGKISVATESALGVTPGGVTANNLYFNGGTLHTTADMSLDVNRGILFGGNGGAIEVNESTVLIVNGALTSEASVFGYTSNVAVGRLDKLGQGTLVLTQFDNTYNGLTDIREGTLIWSPAAEGSTTRSPFGSNSAFLDGTIVRSGATLEIAAPGTSTNQTTTMQEWFTFEGGSTLNMALLAANDRNLVLNGVIKLDSLGHAGTSDGIATADSVAGATTMNIGRRTTHLNNAGGYLTGDGGITKIGAGALAFRENNPEWTGQLIVNEGLVEVYSAGNPLGVGTMPIILGHNLAAELTGEAESGNSTAQLLFRDEGGYRDVSTITQDIIVRSDGGAGTQTKYIGARYMADVDVVNYAGSLTLNDNVTFFYQDDVRNSTDQANASSSTAAANTRNDTRSLGAATNSETVFINFNGNIIGAKDISTNVTQGGNGNVANGSITGANDDFVLRPIFSLNGDNSAWTGELTLGNTSSDVDRQHIIRFGQSNSISAVNAVTMHSNATLQTGGQDVTIGSLANPAGAATLDSYIENASTSPGSITIDQRVDASVGVVIRDGINFFALQAGEVDATLSFIKSGPAMLELLKGNSYTGSTTVKEGELKLSYEGDVSMLSDSAALILNNGTLNLAGTGTHEEIVGYTVINGAAQIIRSAGASTIQLNTLSYISGTLHISEDYLATTDTLNDPTTGIIGGWATVGGSWAVNETNSANGAIVGLTTFLDVNRLGGVIPNGPTQNVRIIEAGTTGPVTLGGIGTTTIYTLLQGADGGVGVDPAIIQIDTGSILRIASGGVLLPEGSSALTFSGAGSITAGATDNEVATLRLQNENTTQILTAGVSITDNAGGEVSLRIPGTGTVMLTGNNTYTGQTYVSAGTLMVGDGGTTGNLGSGTVDVAAVATLNFNRSDAALSIDSAITGRGAVLQSGSGTSTLNAASSSELTFIMAAGTLATGVDQAINTTGQLIFGSTEGSTSVGSLDLTLGSATATGLRVQTNTTTANQLLIGSGKTLQINGNVLIGVDLANSTDSALTVSGAGSWVVNSPGGTFQVGAATGSVNGNRAVVDMSGLATFTADLGSSGVFRVGDINGNSAGSGNGASTLTLAADSTITADLLGVGDRQGIGAGVQTLKLGSGTTLLNVNTLSVGDRGSRGSGLLTFNGVDGTLTLRAADGVGRVSVNVLSSTAGTGYNLAGTVDLTGHDADLLISTLEIGKRTTGTGAGTGSFSFDQGILDVTTINLGLKTGGSAATSTIRGTLNIGGGTVIVGTGGITMAENSSTSLTTALAELNFTGGDIQIGGDIVKIGTSSTGAATAKLNLTGSAVLDLTGHAVGSAAQPFDSLIWDSGTLKNVSEINGGTTGLVTSGTDGTLILDGSNTYTGGTQINTGTLQLAATGNTGLGNVSVNSGGILAGAGTVRGDTTVLAGGSVQPGSAAAEIGTLTWSSGTNTTFDSGSSASFLLSSTPGSSDQLSSEGLGTLTLNTGTTFTVTGWDAAYVPNDGDTWQLLDWGSIVGTFDVGTNLRSSGSGGGDLILPDLGTSYFWDVSNFLSSGVIAVVVPEPSRGMLLILACMIGFARRRRGGL